MSNLQNLGIIGGTVLLIIGVVGFALYNEGILMSNTYENTRFGYEVNIPRGYQLGVVYMEYLDQTNRSRITPASSTEFLPEMAETVVLTKQIKSDQQKYVEWMQQNPNLAIEQLCECVVISTNLFPAEMADLIRTRDINDGIASTTDGITTDSGETLTVYTNRLSHRELSDDNDYEYREISREKRFADIFFDQPYEFSLQGEYNNNITMTVYGLTLSLFTGENQTASLQDIVSALEF